MTSFEKAISKIDEYNAQDPHKEVWSGISYPKEVLYAERMTQKLSEFNPNASEALRLAARAQHIGRWEIPREEYPDNRSGYLRWREALKKFHANTTEAILQSAGYEPDFIARVTTLIRKKGLKNDPGVQTLEDVICLVFLEFYFEDFAGKHPEDKIVDIIQKTWNKMSEDGRNAALSLPLSESSLHLIQKAIG
ncbi:DUF4202 domain-containing protein [Robertkochia solimangrovi]|uniref:DUF4202 domain-containing protein n=1 Tax=Robertkochia solimangrovi TaxID=2213046 RepID=UPI00117E4218|nr:DUF4202 domain-containing protein [Robertkochia solimangrovi]TRZ42282.1 DUF4202 domain-containing protein [Robertkochia solimangrovi]